MDDNTNTVDPTAIIPSSDIDNVVDIGIGLTDTVVAIVKEVGEMLSGVPYVKALSGVILQFIKIRDEIKANKARCHELIDKILRMSKNIYAKLYEIAKFEERMQAMLANLKKHLEECTRTLSDILTALQKYKSRNGLARLVNRDLDELNAWDRRVDELKDTLFLHVLVDIRYQQASSASKDDKPDPALNPQLVRPDHILPPKPSFMVERDAQLNSIVAILLAPETSRVVLLGGGGFGKSTLARSILHDTRITARYQACYFMSCEEMINSDTLLLGFGNMMGITATPSDVLASSRRILARSTTLLCLDNFETPWEPSGTRGKVEDILASIADIPNLSLIVTMRGEQRPAKVVWTHPLLQPLSTLSLPSAKLILQYIAPNHVVDSDTEKILEAIEGIPLGITLISNLLRDGETSQSLWKRWSKEQTRVVENGGDDRESNLNASIALSVYGPRMTRDPDAVKLLAALSLLPGGFRLDAIENLEDGLNIMSIHRPLQTLRAVALVRTDEASPSPRIQILSPIRLFCNHFLSFELRLGLDTIIGYYISVLSHAKYRVSNSEFYMQVVPELRNIHSVFQRGYTTGYSRAIAELIKATCYLTDWSLYTGYAVEETLKMAIARSTDLSINNAECYMMLGKLYRWEGHLERARECFRTAAVGYQEQNNLAGEAQVLGFLAALLRRPDQLDQAERTLQRSLQIYNQTNNRLGQATVRKGLGKLYVETSKYPEAETNLTSALAIFKEILDLVGQVNTCTILADLNKKRGNPNEGEKYAKRALIVAIQAHYRTGQGNALYYLGRLYIELDRVDEARQVCEEAHKIYQEIKDPVSEFNTANKLGSIYIQQDQLTAALELLTMSFRDAPGIIQKPMLLFTLGWVYICANELDRAEEVLKDARKRFQEFRNIVWEADIISHLGSIHLKRNQLEDAERILGYVPRLGVWPDVEMKRLCTLGDLYILQSQFDMAETSLNTALVFAQEQKCSYQQGNIFRSIGSLYVKKGYIDQAIQAYRQAFEFHQKAQWISEQATDLRCLGEAQGIQGNLNEAKAAFKGAETLMNSVKEARNLV